MVFDTGPPVAAVIEGACWKLLVRSDLSRSLNSSFISRENSRFVRIHKKRLLRVVWG